MSQTVRKQESAVRAGSGPVGRYRSLAAAIAVPMLLWLILTGCAVQRQAINTDDYVEVDNPFSDESGPGGSQKIWVPRRSLEAGVPRGKELFKKGYEAVAGKPSPEQTAVVDAAVPPRAGLVRTRLLIAEAGEPSLAGPLTRFLSRGVTVRALTKPAAGVAGAEQLSYLKSLSGQPAGGPVLLLNKPEGGKPGARLKADLYDIRGPILLRSFTTTVQEPAKGETQDDALLSAVKGLADAALKSLEWFAWYGRVVSVSNGRVYIDAGAESGLKPGQKLVVRRGGEAIKGIGFAPGEQITTFSITTLVGSDGAYGTTPEAPRVLPGDYVELEQ